MRRARFHVGRPAPPIQIRPLGTAELAEWDAIVRLAQEGTVYHDSRWLSLIARAAGNRAHIRGVFLEGHLVGGIPLQVRKRGPLSLARRAFATPYANPVFRDTLGGLSENCAGTLFEDLAKSYSVVTVAGSPFAMLPGSLVEGWKLARRATYVLDISDTDKLWARFGHQLRKKIQRAERRGIEIVSPCEPSVFFELYNHTFARQGLRTPMNREGFAGLLTALTDMNLARSYLARTAEGAPVVARLVLFDERRAYCALSGADFSVIKGCTSELLIWQIIQDFSETHSEMDLVGANIESISAFKRKFKGRLVQYQEATHFRSGFEKCLIRLYQRRKKSRSGVSAHE
jgi:hypothetical protein